MIEAGVSGHIRTHIADGVLTITIDRPAAKNAMSVAMRQELEALCAEVDRTDDVAVMMLTGVDDVFSAGADVREIAQHRGALPPTNPGAAFRSVRKPTIAAVNGVCVTGGLELALSCDWIVASDQARFADTHARLGVLPRWGMSGLLPARIGTARAKEMTLTGRFVAADEAHAIGLAARVLPHEGFSDHVRAMACEVAAVPAAVAEATLALYDEGAGSPLAVALDLEQQRIETFQSEPGALGNS